MHAKRFCLAYIHTLPRDTLVYTNPVQEYWVLVAMSHLDRRESLGEWAFMVDVASFRLEMYHQDLLFTGCVSVGLC